MHSLLKRQIRKFLSEQLLEKEEVAAFLEAVDKSYDNYDGKCAMMQRAMSVSSEELSNANADLRNETERQQKILESLEKAIQHLNTAAQGELLPKNGRFTELDPLELTEYIENQATRIVQMTTEKNVLLKDLEKQNKVLNDYAHMVSHDMKSPIRNISALMSWVVETEKGKFSEDSLYNCELISKNLAKLDKLISDVLRYSTIDAVRENKTRVDINPLIEELTGDIMVPKNVQIDIPRQLPVIYIEKYFAEQLFKNLLSNAVHATQHLPQGKVTITFEEKTDFWKFVISDNGKGIPINNHSSVFKMFNKLENGSYSSGVGLAMVEKIVDLLKGEVWLDSTENIGTSFFFTLCKYEKRAS